MKTGNQHGFTLIELMMTIMVIAILAAIAYPSYDEFIRRSRLENVRGDLLENARRLESFYARNRTFNGFNELKNDNKYFDIFFVYNPLDSTLGNHFVGTSNAAADPDVGHYLLTAKAKASTNGKETRFMQLNDDGITTICTGQATTQAPVLIPDTGTPPKECEMY